MKESGLLDTIIKRNLPNDKKAQCVKNLDEEEQPLGYDICIGAFLLLIILMVISGFIFFGRKVGPLILQWQVFEAEQGGRFRHVRSTYDNLYLKIQIKRTILNIEGRL